MNDSLRKLSNDDLVRKLDQDVARERAMTIVVLHDLNEMDRRRLYLDRGCSSLFDYCVRKLKYSSSAAARRIQAARCIRRFPDVLGMPERNEITLSTVATVASILRPDNVTTILNRVRGASCRQVERIACEYRSPVKLRDQVRPVRVVTPGAGSGKTRRIRGISLTKSGMPCSCGTRDGVLSWPGMAHAANRDTELKSITSGRTPRAERTTLQT